jgi:hypothetical protein
MTVQVVAAAALAICPTRPTLLRTTSGKRSAGTWRFGAVCGAGAMGMGRRTRGQAAPAPPQGRRWGMGVRLPTLRTHRPAGRLRPARPAALARRRAFSAGFRFSDFELSRCVCISMCTGLRSSSPHSLIFHISYFIFHISLFNFLPTPPRTSSLTWRPGSSRRTSSSASCAVLPPPSP